MLTQWQGENEKNEIEDIDEFHKKIDGHDLATFAFADFVFQGVDFSSVAEEQWNKYGIPVFSRNHFFRYNFKGAWFWGCTLPTYTSAEKLRAAGCFVWENLPDLPFKTFRAFMYRQEELKEVCVTKSPVEF